MRRVRSFTASPVVEVSNPWGQRVVVTWMNVGLIAFHGASHYRPPLLCKVAHRFTFTVVRKFTPTLIAAACCCRVRGTTQGRIEIWEFCTVYQKCWELLQYKGGDKHHCFLSIMNSFPSTGNFLSWKHLNNNMNEETQTDYNSIQIMIMSDVRDRAL